MTHPTDCAMTKPTHSHTSRHTTAQTQPLPQWWNTNQEKTKTSFTLQWTTKKTTTNEISCQFGSCGFMMMILPQHKTVNENMPGQRCRDRMRTPLNQAEIFFVQLVLEPTSGAALVTPSAIVASTSFWCSVEFWFGGGCCCCCCCWLFCCCCWFSSPFSASDDSFASNRDALDTVIMPWRLIRTLTFTFCGLPSAFGRMSFTIQVPGDQIYLYL